MPEYQYFFTERAITYSPSGSLWYYYRWWYASTKERFSYRMFVDWLVEAYYLRMIG